MSGVIRILPRQLADKIAAGEVVGRPAAALKELIENALDAGARAITVVVNDGGRSLLRVVDDGSGMGDDDARLAFARHATSKIARAEDLEAIATLGFRGEALASIAAVSQVELRTRRHGDPVGTRVRVEGGDVVEQAPEAPPPGTSVAVKNLFYNTPARRRFLKSDATEYKYCADAVMRAALAHPAAAFTFVADGEEVFAVPAVAGAEADALRSRADRLLKFGAHVAAVVEDSPAGRLTAFLGKPEYARRSRAEQFVFLNGRPIVSRNINHAVAQGYERLLEKGSYPFYLLFLTVDPHSVDVNVHPSKTEVKFADEAAMHRFVAAAVRGALSRHDLIPEAAVRSVAARDAGGGGPSAQGVKEELFAFSTRSAGDLRPQNWENLLVPPAPSGGATPGEPAGPRTGDAPLWQIHNKYIVLPTTEGMMIVDQHAAHERVLYERAVRRFETGEHASQQLLFPQALEMPAGDVALVGALAADLERLGFSLKLFGRTTVIVDGVPVDVRAGEETTILRRIIELYKEDEVRVRLEPRERLARSWSCRAAVKSGDSLKEGEMRTLLDQLFATSIPFVCPHGRPVMVKLPLAEIDRRFGRTS